MYIEKYLIKKENAFYLFTNLYLTHLPSDFLNLLTKFS